jgi:hypothetical protein
MRRFARRSGRSRTGRRVELTLQPDLLVTSDPAYPDPEHTQVDVEAFISDRALRPIRALTAHPMGSAPLPCKDHTSGDTLAFPVGN